MARWGEGLLLVPLNSLKGPAVKPVTGQREGRTDGEREERRRRRDVGAQQRWQSLAQV